MIRTAATRDPRLVAFFGFIGLAFFVLLGQLWNIQIASGSQFRQRADYNRIRVVSEKPLRGVIYDRAGRQIVRNVPSFTASIRPADLPKDKAGQQAVFERLSKLIGVPVEEIRADVDAARQDPFTPAVIKTNITREQALILEEQHTNLPGVVPQFTPIRTYPEGALFGQLLGYTGPVPAGSLDTLLSEGYERDDTLGLSGIEASFEDVLRGSRGEKQVEVDAMGRVTNELSTLSPTVPGGDLVMTIDSEFQRQAADALARAMNRVHSSQGALVAIQPQTGEVLAMISLPQYDDNLFAGGISPADYKRLSDDPWRPLVDHAVAGQWPPGSTFKLVTAAAALQEKVVKPDQRLNCPGSITVQGQTFLDWDLRGHGNVSTRQAIAVSCDIYFYTVSGGNPYTGLQGLGNARLAQYAHAFGLGEKTGIRLPGETAGLYPTAEWKKQQKQESWFIGDDYNDGIGQGDILATPLQLANMVATVANGGTVFRPRLVSAVKDSDGHVVQTLGPEVIRKVPVSPEYLAAIRAGMRDAVTTETGTAYFALRSYSTPIAGKTGSAEYGPRGKDGKSPTHALFVGFAPYDNPQIAVAVVIYGGGEGSDVAAPPAAEVMKSYVDQQAQQPS